MKNKLIGLFLVFILVYSIQTLLLQRKVFAGGALPVGNTETTKVIVTEALPNNNEVYRPVIINKSKESTSNDINWKELLIGAGIGWLAGFFSVWLVDKLKEPYLVFEVGSVADDNIKKWRFLHVKIKNLKKSHWYNPFTSSPAFACKALIQIEGKEFVGRWSSKEQPIGTISEVLNIALVHPREDIYPYTGEQEAVELVLAIKYENENEFYGFNNESYLHPDFKNKDREFGLGSLRGKVVISTLGKTFPQPFIIHNKSQKRQDFGLELVNKN